MYAFRIHENVDGAVDNVIRNGLVAQLPKPASIDIARWISSSTNYISEHIEQYRNRVFGPWSPYISVSRSLLWSLWAMNKGYFRGLPVIYLVDIPTPRYSAEGAIAGGEKVWRSEGNVVDISVNNNSLAAPGRCFAAAAREVLVTQRIGPESIVGYTNFHPVLEILRSRLPELAAPSASAFFENLKGLDTAQLCMRLEAATEIFASYLSIFGASESLRITPDQQRDWLLVDSHRLGLKVIQVETLRLFCWDITRDSELGGISENVGPTSGSLSAETSSLDLRYRPTTLPSSYALSTAAPSKISASEKPKFDPLSTPPMDASAEIEEEEGQVEDIMTPPRNAVKRAVKVDGRGRKGKEAQRKEEAWFKLVAAFEALGISRS